MIKDFHNLKKRYALSEIAQSKIFATFIKKFTNPEITMEKPTSCNSCNKRIANESGSSRFECPECGKSEIVRCKNCREIVAKYKCPECGFTGPN